MEPRRPRTRLEVIRPFTTRVVNPVTRLVAGRLPGFAILHQRGRRSGRTYDTPMNVFRSEDTYLFALTYGSHVDWVRNVVAARGCTMTTRGRRVRLRDRRSSWIRSGSSCLSRCGRSSAC
jgi:hypothetical protein